MKSSWHKRYTVSNNINATNNVLAAVVEIWGGRSHRPPWYYGGLWLRQRRHAHSGRYLEVELETEDGREIRKEILYPSDPGSIYHMTKTQDQLLFAFYNKNDKVKITDLHQGIVWGTQTHQTSRDEP